VLAAIALAGFMPSAVLASAPESFGVIRFRPQWTSSDCIGEPRTPLCAVETSFACWLRSDAQMCRMIGLDVAWETDPNPRTGSLGSEAIFYTVEKQVEIQQSDLKTFDKAIADRVQPGDVAIRIMVFYCGGSDICRATRHGSRTGLIRDCPPTRCVFGGYPTRRDHLHPRRTIRVARQTAQNWIVVQAPEHGFQFPDSFWNSK
jgi:hypothetical protein